MDEIDTHRWVCDNNHLHDKKVDKCTICGKPVRKVKHHLDDIPKYGKQPE